MKLKPLRDNVLVKRLKEEAVTKAGLFIPEVAQKQLNQGSVIDVGPGITQSGTHIPMSVKPGDKVYFGKYAGSPINIDGEEMFVLPEREIFGVEEVCA